MDIYVLVVMVGLERKAEYFFTNPNNCYAAAKQIDLSKYNIPLGTLAPHNKTRTFCFRKPGEQKQIIWGRLN